MSLIPHNRLYLALFAFFALIALQSGLIVNCFGVLNSHLLIGFAAALAGVYGCLKGKLPRSSWPALDCVFWLLFGPLLGLMAWMYVLTSWVHHRPQANAKSLMY